MLRGRIIQSGRTLYTALHTETREERPQEVRQYHLFNKPITRVRRPQGVRAINASGTLTRMRPNGFRERAIDPTELVETTTEQIRGVPRRLEGDVIAVPIERDDRDYWACCVVGGTNPYYQPGCYHISVPGDRVRAGVPLTHPSLAS